MNIIYKKQDYFYYIDIYYCFYNIYIHNAQNIYILNKLSYEMNFIFIILFVFSLKMK